MEDQKAFIEENMKTEVEKNTMLRYAAESPAYLQHLPLQGRARKLCFSDDFSKLGVKELQNVLKKNGVVLHEKDIL